MIMEFLFLLPYACSLCSSLSLTRLFMYAYRAAAQPGLAAVAIAVFQEVLWSSSRKPVQSFLPWMFFFKQAPFGQFPRRSTLSAHFPRSDGVHSGLLACLPP